MDEEALRGDRLSRRSDSPTEPSHIRSPEPDPDSGLLSLDRPVIDRYVVQLVVDRELADSVSQLILTQLPLDSNPATNSQSSSCRSRVPLRDELIELIRSLQKSGEFPISMPEIDPSIEQLRFDTIWRTALLDRSWRRLEALQRRLGLPLHLALRQRSEAPGLSIAELASRLSQALDRPVSEEKTQLYLRRAVSEFSRILLEEVIATLPDGSPFDAIERELIDTNLLAFCRVSFAELRESNQSGRAHRRKKRPPR